MIHIKTLVRTKHKRSRTRLEKMTVAARDHQTKTFVSMTVAKNAMRGNPSLKSTMARQTTALEVAAALTTLAV